MREALLKDFESKNDQEIDVIHDRLQEVSDHQVSLLFDAIKKANKIVGHVAHDRQWINEMFMEDRGRY